jgi:phosphohistidine phosphatase
MKTLLLMRHAKSSWKDEQMADHDRPLNKRGLREAPIMGEMLRDKELVPQQILSSSALRAVSTAEVVSKETGYKGTIDALDSLYLAEPQAYIDALTALPDTLERVLVIGHNPGLETLLQLLSGHAEPMSTASVAYLSLPIKTWKELEGKSEGELVQLWRIEEEKVEKKDKKKVKEKKKDESKDKSKEKKEKKGKKEKKKTQEKKKGKAKKK